MNLTTEQLRRNRLLQEELSRQQKIARHLTPAKDANDNEVMVRGVVDPVRCKRCKQPRWNDGTPCKYEVTVQCVKGKDKTVPCGCREVVSKVTETEEPTL